jgi:hypothetical protein
VIVRSIRSAIVLAAMLCLAGPGRATEFACTPDQCIKRINEIVRKTNEGLVAAKDKCEEQGDARRCIYRSSSGPSVHLMFSTASPNVQVIVIGDARGLSPAGGVYIGAIMEAFDTSLNAEARKQFYNKLLAEFAGSFERGGQVQMSSEGLTYALFTTEKLTIFSVSGAN